MKNNWNRLHISPATPISYHAHLEEEFGNWAHDCGMERMRLRAASETAIRERHNTEGCIDSVDRAVELQPDVYNLFVENGVQVFYTVEEEGVVIRGYAWGLESEPRDELDGGSYICEPEWYPERLARAASASFLRPNRSTMYSWFTKVLKKVLDFGTHLMHRSVSRKLLHPA